jgi:hypothetical protein
VISVENPSVLAYIRALPARTGSDEPHEQLDGEEGWSEPPDQAQQLDQAESAYPGHGGSDTVLCVCNLSRLAQPAELPLQRWEGKVPIELLGRVPFPRIGELPYFVTLAPYGFYWFELADPPGGH